MKDKFGTFRGKCVDGCACIEFKANPDGTSVRCSECNHAPIKHESFGMVGTCRGCNECKMFEASYGEFAYCEYCECSINLHCPVKLNPVVSPPEPASTPQEETSAPSMFTPPKQQEIVKSSLQAGIGGVEYQQMGATPFNTVSPTESMDSAVSINTMGPNIPTNQTGQVPMEQAPINQFGQASMGNMGQASMNQLGQVPMGQVPMNQMGGAQFNPTDQMYQMRANHMFSPNMNQQFMAPQPQQMMQAANPMKCAIQECDQPPFYDPVNGMQTCCSITHAMEHERRKALGNNMVKGITHCLLPSCNRHVWPFMNYCGRTHADAGKQLGLIPPDPNKGTPSQKEVSEGVCTLPGCNKLRFLDEGTEHPYCSRSHAAQGSSQGISLESAAKPEDRCAIPGCWKPKFIEVGVTHPFCSKSHRKKAEALGSKLIIDPNAQCDFPGCNIPKLVEKCGTQQDYCSKRHSEQDTPRRDAAILTDRKEVEKWLKTFPNLTVTDIKENPHAHPGGELFKIYKEKYKSLAKNNRKTALAFHGTAEANIDSICQNGYNASLRRGQAHGPGEYFATSPDISFSYCRGGKRMMVNELLLGTPNQHHTQSGGIIVMKDPAHDLPRFVITFQ